MAASLMLSGLHCVTFLAGYSNPSAPSKPSVSQPQSVSSSSSSSSSFPGAAKTGYCGMKIKPARASAEGTPGELIEDSKFVPLNDNDPSFGPPALLLLGFDLEEMQQIKELLKDLDGEFMEVIYCTEDMITQSLWQAMNTKQSNFEELKIAKSVPRICFLSGLSGEETMMFIDAFSEAGIEPAVFAALVPNSAEKPLQELIDEIMGDHEMMTGKSSAG